MSDSELEVILSAIDPGPADIVDRLRQLVRATVPDAVEEPDPSASLIGYTFQPGTYKGLILAIAPHAKHVNLMFSKGVELLDVDSSGLLDGTGKRARHIKFAGPDDVDRPEVRALVEEAARRTPRT